MRIEKAEAARLLKEWDRIFILLHHFPDGDTIGSGCALCAGLQRMGKQAAIACSHSIPERYSYITDLLIPMEFEPQHIVAVDVADPKLLGEPLESFGEKVELCIDHHGSNLLYAQKTCLDASAAATCEIVTEILELLQVSMDSKLAAALYTGIATDTGCFKYGNTTAKTHRLTAQLMETGLSVEEINRIMFDTKSKQRMALERMALEQIEFAFDDTCALLAVTRQMREEAQVTAEDLEGITTLPRQIEGVLVGVTLREQEDGFYKVSVRTHAPLDASAICGKLGGGGHPGAAGCKLKGPLSAAKEAIKQAVREQLDERIFTHQ